MPSDVPNLTTIRDRLESLLKCLLTHAEEDAAFAEELAQVLTSGKPLKAVRVKTQPDVNLVEILKTQGAEVLFQVLTRFSDEELREIARRYKVPAKVKGMTREQLVDCLSQKAKERLGRGSVFIDPQPDAVVDGATKEPAEAGMSTEQEQATSATVAEADAGMEEADITVSTECQQEKSSESKMD